MQILLLWQFFRFYFVQVCLKRMNNPDFVQMVENSGTKSAQR